MTRIKIRHYVVKRGKGFWQPTKTMRAAGFYPVPCGPDGPNAWQRAEEWNHRWDMTRCGEAPSPATVSADNLSPEKSEELSIYPPHSLGEAFDRAAQTGWLCEISTFNWKSMCHSAVGAIEAHHHGLNGVSISRSHGFVLRLVDHSGVTRPDRPGYVLSRD
jgi:hypothetical protein